MKEIRELVEEARYNVNRNINIELLLAYWNVGRLIVNKEHSEQYDERSVRDMLHDISKGLTRHLGKGFSRSQLTYMRLFFLRFPIFQVPDKFGVTVSHQKRKVTKSIGLTVSHQLSWSHYYELLKCTDDLEISFYQQTAITESWSVRELRRMMDTSLFERIALSKNKKSVIVLAANGRSAVRSTEIAKDPYVLEFLNIPEHYNYTERQLEQKIIDHLQQFILELCKGFSFVARQFRITLNNKHYRVDLVFYNRFLKCFVLIDLKIKAAEHNDIGQMNLYLNYFETQQNSENDNQPIGIILSKYKNDVNVEFAIRGITNKIFVSKYQTYLPNKKILKIKVMELLNRK